MRFFTLYVFAFNNRRNFLIAREGKEKRALNENKKEVKFHSFDVNKSKKNYYNAKTLKISLLLYFFSLAEMEHYNGCNFSADARLFIDVDIICELTINRHFARTLLWH